MRRVLFRSNPWEPVLNLFLLGVTGDCGRGEEVGDYVKRPRFGRGGGKSVIALSVPGLGD